MSQNPDEPGQTDLARLQVQAARAAAEAAEARAKAAEAAAAAAAAELAAAQQGSGGTTRTAPTPAPAADAAAAAPPASTAAADTAAAPSSGDAPAGSSGGASAPTARDAPASGGASSSGSATASSSGGASALARKIAAGYAFGGPVLPLGALLEDGTPEPSAQVGVPLGMLNRHALVAGATGTGKTRTLQLMAEQLSTAGVPVFVADIKGDLTGMAVPGEPSDKLTARTAALGQQWSPTSFPVDFYALGGLGHGVPVRTTITEFGPLLLAKVLGLNQTQESSLGLIFHWADQQSLPLLDLKDLREAVTYLTSDQGKEELKGIGGLSQATAGVILRELVTFESQGAEAFFGEPAFEVSELLRTAADGRGVVSAMELAAVQDRPALFSTFLMWLLAELFQALPEVGDPEKPRLVFFFDEAHLLFSDASKEFLGEVTRTVRLIRSKGVGIVFVTQSPKDIPADVLGQLGSRVQHALRAFTPDDAAALRAAARTYPTSEYDLEQTLQQLGTGEAIVTVLSDKGTPTPVAWTRLRAPQASMAAAPDATVLATVAASPLQAKYGTAVDRQSAYEMLQAKAQQTAAERAAAEQAEAQQKAAEKEARSSRSSGRKEASPLDSIWKAANSPLARQITRTVLGTLLKR